MFTEYYYLTNNNTTWGNNKFNVYTTVEDLPVGTYTMSCYAFAKEQNYSSGDPVPAVYFYANETQGSLVDNARLTEKSISFINEEQQNVKIGLKPLTGNTYNWMGIGYVELYKEYTDNTTYGINVGSVSNATVAVTVDGEAATSAKALKTVTMTFTPEAGYAVSSVTATYNDGEEKAIDVANPSENVYTFQMPAYDVSVAAAVVVDKRALATAISSASGARKTANEGTGAFQIPAAAGTTLAGAITDAQNVYNNGAATVSDVTTAISTLNTAVETYEATTLNAPDAEKHYNIIVATAEHAKNGNAVVESLGATGVNNPTGYSFNASAAPNVNLAQAVKFTQVSGNNYNISFETSEGVVYLTYGALNGSAANWKNSQIQGTTDSAKKGEFKIAATATANVFNIYNTITNSTIACQTGGSLYTEAGNADFTIAEASQATVDITISSAVKYATRIFPFTPTTWPNGVVAYSCEETEDNVLTLEKVDVPVANTPYILYAEGGSTGSVSGWGTAPSTDAKKVGLLTGVYANTSAPVNSYVLQNNNDKVGFYKVAADHEPTVGAYRCYLTDGENARAAFFFRGDITGVANVEAATEATLKDGKYLENGKIVIVKNGVKYNAAGAQVK